MKPVLFEQAVLVSYQVALILMTYSFVLMVNKRLLTDIVSQEEKFSKAFHAAPYAVMLTRLSDGTIFDVNETFGFITGYDRAEIIGKKTTDITLWGDPKDRTIVIDALSRNGNLHGKEFPFRKKDGQAVTGLLSAEVITISGEMTILSCISDITERKRAEEENTIIAEIGRVIGSTLNIEDVYERVALEAKKLIHFDNITVSLIRAEENALSMVYVSGIDIPNRRKGDRIPYQGSLSEAVASDRKGMVIQSKQLNDDDILKKFPHLTPVVQLGLISTLSVPLISMDHVIGVLVFRSKERDAYTERDLHLAERIGTQMAGAIANAQLFHELTKTEKALRESEEHYQSLLEQASDGIFILDMEGKILSINKSFAEMHGFTVEEMLHLGLDRLDVEGIAPVSERIQRIMKGETLSFDVEHYHKDGHTFPLSVKANLVSSGNTRMIIAVHRDLTDRRKAEEERRVLEERLQRSEKMEALGTLSGGVAHDLNNVLGVVVGYSEMLLDQIDPSGPLRRGLENIMNGGLKAAAIVEDLLTLARRGVQGRTILNLNRIIADCRISPEVAKLASRYPSVKIETDLAPDLLNISGSSVHLSKTLYNLISNASEAMTQGGVLNIKTTNRYLDKPIHGYDQIREGDYVVLSVSDTGEGISAEDQRRIFEPFYTKKVMGRSGTGLGLAVVWGTVKDHNGYIDVQSEEGRGSLFTLYFPATREEVSAEAAIVPPSEYMGNGETILVVDDVKEQRELAAGILKSLDYHVSTLSSGEEAIAYLQDHPVDLMVLDMIMDPGMDGLDTYRNILAIHPGQKAIIVSGFSESYRVKAARELGAGDYVRKPYIKEKLGIAVRKELDRFV